MNILTESMRLFIVLMTAGKLDYLPGANTPWSCDFLKNRGQGRGKTALAALRHYLVGDRP